MIQRAFGITEALRGGLFIPHKNARDQRHGYWADASAGDAAATMGTHSTTRVHRFDELIQYSLAPAQ
jgi:hypothetical protein